MRRFAAGASVDLFGQGTSICILYIIELEGTFLKLGERRPQQHTTPSYSPPQLDHLQHEIELQV